MANPLSLRQLKKDFPFLSSGVAYLDNASTAQKPRQVIDAVSEYYTSYAANVHRGIYAMSEQATTAYEQVRDATQRFIGAKQREEIIFTSGTTQSLNLVARLLTQRLQKGDEILLTELEHHSNLIPWQLVAKEKGLVLKFLKTRDDQQLHGEDLQQLISTKSRILSLTHVSNASGYVAPVKTLAAIAHEHNLIVVVDAAQSTPHIPIDVRDLGVDFLAFSAHKMCGPTGVGVLYGKQELLSQYEPVFGGGHMIAEVNLQSATWAELPYKFEPGTPNIAGVIGFDAALRYLDHIGMNIIHEHVNALYHQALNAFEHLPGVTVFGPKDRKVRNSIISFAVEGVHPHDLATILDKEGVAVRAGHHCAQPLMRSWGVPATTRASLYFYNTEKDIERLVAGIQKAQHLFRV